MASAPTGDAPADDEQPSAEEKPEVDGNPPVGEPRPEEESSIDVPPARPPPRLRMKARKFVQFFVGKERRRLEELEIPDRLHVRPARTLLVGRRWLDAFVDAADFGAAHMFFALGRASMGKLCPRAILIVMTAGGVAALLRLARPLTAIDVLWAGDPGGGNFAGMREWTQVASKLHALPNLTAIRLTAKRVKHAEAEFLVASLPDRLVRVKTNQLRMATMLRKRTTPLESLELVTGALQHSYIADVFRSKSARIKLWWPPRGASPAAHPLHDCGPLARNERLQELRIPAEIFAKSGTPEALRRLRAVNEHFKLVCNGIYRFPLEELPHLKRVERLASKAKKFAAAMGNAGFRSGGDELWIHFIDAEKWQQVSREQIFERLDWTREGEIPWPECSKSLPTCSHVHKGVRILVGLGSD